MSENRRQPAHRAPPPGRPALHAPWRERYIESLDDADPTPDAGSFLEDYWRHPERDEENLVIARTDRGMVLLNRYPYAGGHLLVALGSARPRLLDYDADERRHLWELVDRAAGALETALRPQGINIGVNQGRAAGAGVPSHLHVHLVPRWSGDVNFMAVVGDLRVIPNSLETMAQRLRAAW